MQAKGTGPDVCEDVEDVADAIKHLKIFHPHHSGKGVKRDAHHSIAEAIADHKFVETVINAFNSNVVWKFGDIPFTDKPEGHLLSYQDAVIFIDNYETRFPWAMDKIRKNHPEVVNIHSHMIKEGIINGRDRFYLTIAPLIPTISKGLLERLEKSGDALGRIREDLIDTIRGCVRSVGGLR